MNKESPLRRSVKTAKGTHHGLDDYLGILTAGKVRSLYSEHCRDHQKGKIERANQIFGVSSFLVCFLVGVGMEVVISG